VIHNLWDVWVVGFDDKLSRTLVLRRGASINPKMCQIVTIDFFEGWLTEGLLLLIRGHVFLKEK
jgi:hypothetical protein